MTGKIHSKETRDKISKAGRLRIPWNKGIKTGIIPKTAFKKGIVAWNKGKKNCFSAEVIERFSKIRKGRLSNMKGKKHSSESIKKMKEAKRPAPWNKGIKGLKGHSVSKETREKIRNAQIGVKRPHCSGENSWKWIIDRSKLKTDRRQAYDYQYKDWMKNVKDRDKWKCKINNKNCCGKLEAHHILPWSQFPELRYNINNGISLCHFHHPRKKIDEKKFAPIFKRLVLTKV